MRLRNGFISNSSSCSFIITNQTKQAKTLVDFALETSFLVQQFNDEYSGDVSLGDLIRDAEKRELLIEPGDQELVFGDEQGDTLGRVYDYILRGGGSTKNFAWRFNEFLR